MTYHLARNGQQLGTCTREEAVARYARGEILPTDLVWSEGMAAWAAASSVFGAPSAAPTPPPMASATPSTTTAASGSLASGPTPGATVVPPRKPDNFLVWSILATVLCCLPAGVVGIVYAAQVDGKYNSGDYAGAEQAAKNARMWTFISAGISLVVGVGYAIFIAIAAATNAHY